MPRRFNNYSMPPEIRQAICRLYQMGESMENIGRRYGIHRQTVRKYVVASGLIDPGERESDTVLCAEVTAAVNRWCREHDRATHERQEYERNHCRVWRKGHGMLTDPRLVGAWVDPPSVVLGKLHG